MITIKNLNKRLKKLEDKTISEIDMVNYIARKKIWTGDDNYENEKNNLIKRNFKLIKREPKDTLWNRFAGNYGEEETWEKEYANGSF